MPTFAERAEPRHSHDRGAAPLLIEMYEIGPDGEPIVSAPPPCPPRRTIGETIEVWRRALDVVQEHARIANSPGGHAVAQVDFPTLTGFREDVQMTVHADPRAATAAVVADDFLAHDFAGLHVDASSLRTHRTELSWSVSLRTSPWRRRPAVLRLSPSASLHVTVLRLTPVKSQRMATRAFIRSGLRATYAFVDRLEHELGLVPPQGLEP